MCRDRKQRICQSINIETKFFPLHLQRSLPYADLWGVDFAALLVSLCNSNIDIIKHAVFCQACSMSSDETN